MPIVSIPFECTTSDEGGKDEEEFDQSKIKWLELKMNTEICYSFRRNNQKKQKFFFY